MEIYIYPVCTHGSPDDATTDDARRLCMHFCTRTDFSSDLNVYVCIEWTTNELNEHNPDTPS
jgi:hypothetical protein